MPFIMWSGDLCVGHDVIDAQHKKLVDIINNLFDAINAKQTGNVLDGIFAELIDYTNFHFGDEERFMEECNYPVLADHKHEHSELVKKVLYHKEQFIGNKKMFEMKLMNFLKDWLIEHIYHSDKKFHAYLNNK
ncbi:MAG: hemerythrin family protein [Nitrospirae bacterium]|nr:hemerythrin family protein [Nitrospirota bacterium]